MSDRFLHEDTQYDDRTKLTEKQRRVANLGFAPIGISVIYLSNWLLLGLSFLGFIYGVLIIAFSGNSSDESLNFLPSEFDATLGVLYASFFAGFFYLIFSANRQLLLGKSLLSTIEAIIGVMLALVLMADPMGVTLGIILLLNFGFHLYSLKIDSSVKRYLDKIR